MYGARNTVAAVALPILMTTAYGDGLERQATQPVAETINCKVNPHGKKLDFCVTHYLDGFLARLCPFTLLSSPQCVHA